MSNKYLNNQGRKPIRASDLNRLDYALSRVALLYADYPDRLATACQITTIIKISDLYPGILEEAVSNRMLELKFKWEVQNERRKFRLPSKRYAEVMKQCFLKKTENRIEELDDENQ